MALPYFSVIIPNYNHARFLVQRIESVINQTFQDFEIIILDDCSTDNSKEIIEQYRDSPKVSKIIYNKINSGSPFKQWERGINLARGEWIWIAESDDWVDNIFLEELIQFAERDPMLGMVYCQSFDIDESGKILLSRIEWTKSIPDKIWENDFIIQGSKFKKYLFQKNVIPNVSACIIRKDIISTIFLNNPDITDYKMTGDWFVWLLLANNAEIKIGFINEHLNYFRGVTTSSRVHNTLNKRLNRVLEEAKMFNSGKIGIAPKDLRNKNFQLRNDWFKLFKNELFPLGFTKLTTFTRENKFWLILVFYIKKFRN